MTTKSNNSLKFGDTIVTFDLFVSLKFINLFRFPKSRRRFFQTSILIFMFGAEKKEPAEESSQTIHLNCKLNDKEYSYLIEIDENGDIVEAGGSEYIQNIVKDKEFKRIQGK